MYGFPNEPGLLYDIRVPKIGSVCLWTLWNLRIMMSNSNNLPPPIPRKTTGSICGITWQALIANEHGFPSPSSMMTAMTAPQFNQSFASHRINRWAGRPGRYEATILLGCHALPAYNHSWTSKNHHETSVTSIINPSFAIIDQLIKQVITGNLWIGPSLRGCDGIASGSHDSAEWLMDENGSCTKQQWYHSCMRISCTLSQNLRIIGWG